MARPKSAAKSAVRFRASIPLLLLTAAAVLAASAATLLAAPAPPQAPPADESVFKDLRSKHPRLMWDEQRIGTVKQAVEKDPLARRWEQRLIAQADKMLTQPPVEHVLIGPRLLDKSRTALDRVSTLAGLYHLTGDKRYVERAKKELETVAAFADWNPSHFLDVAEMTNAVALGYDWLYDELSPEERETLRKAIVEKGLKPGLAVYAKKSGWHTAVHNWNQVCNGGLTVGALAVADADPETRAICARVIAAARASIPRAMASFAPDGGWAEGPGYWNYATRYNVFYLSALETALGTDFGLDKTPGFPETGDFRIQFIGSSGQVFNYADGGPGPGTAAQMFWLARTFDRPAYDASERNLAADKPSIFHLVWFNEKYSTPAAAAALEKMPPSQWFKGAQVVFLRTGPTQDRSADLFVGFKGGDNKANHAHLDLGTFVLDASGKRWALDMGGDEYNLPGYFGKQRWDYYRLRTEGHNTLTLGDENQVTSAKSPIVALDGAAGQPFAVADLSEAYRPKAEKVLRGIALEHGGRVLVQDEVEAKEPAPMTWHFHTDAEVKADGTTAVLTQPGPGGKGTVRLTARVLAPEGVRFEVADASPPPPQHPAPKTKDLMIRLPGNAGETRIAVVFATGDGEAGREALRPLEEWGKK